MTNTRTRERQGQFDRAALPRPDNFDASRFASSYSKLFNCAA